jgi:hypothetical protein
MNTPTNAKKLSLKRETLRELTNSELRLVAGGPSYDSGFSHNCPTR